MEHVPTYVRVPLSAFTAIFLGLFLPGLLFAFRGISQAKATGLAAVAGGLLESLVSPLFWISAAVFFFAFSYAARLNSKLLRIFLFWMPTLLVSMLGLAILTLWVYLLLHSRKL